MLTLLMQRFQDWIIQVLQTLILLAVLALNYFINIPEFMQKQLIDAKIPISDLNVYWRFAIGKGRFFLGAIILCFLLWYIRKNNKGEVLKQTLPDAIVWHTYAGYWYCRYFLNYQTISLTRVPIPMQFKLVYKELFKKYLFMDGITEKTRGTDKVNVVCHQNGNALISTTINLVLADTYPLDWKTQLPSSVHNLTTYVINRSSEDRTRYYSPDFVSTVTFVVRHLPSHVVAVNIFATINPAHCYHIIREVFMTGGRDSIKTLSVYEQSKGNWKFEGKNVTIFKETRR